MINPSDSIRFINVVSKKVRIHFNEMDATLFEFVEEIRKQKGMVKGPLFYSLNNVPMDEMMNVEMFMPVYEDSLSLPEAMSFHSYYSVENMFSICVYHDFEKFTEQAYRMLFEYMEENNLQQATPIYHVLSGDRSFPYMFVKIGAGPTIER